MQLSLILKSSFFILLILSGCISSQPSNQKNNLSNELDTTSIAKENKLQGEVTSQQVISTEAKLSDTEILNKAINEVDTEVCAKMEDSEKVDMCKIIVNDLISIPDFAKKGNKNQCNSLHINYTKELCVNYFEKLTNTELISKEKNGFRAKIEKIHADWPHLIYSEQNSIYNKSKDLTETEITTVKTLFNNAYQNWKEADFRKEQYLLKELFKKYYDSLNKNFVVEVNMEKGVAKSTTNMLTYSKGIERYYLYDPVEDILYTDYQALDNYSTIDYSSSWRSTAYFNQNLLDLNREIYFLVYLFGGGRPSFICGEYIPAKDGKDCEGKLDINELEKSNNILVFTINPRLHILKPNYIMPYDSSTEFSDNFNLSLFGEWEKISGDWKIENGVLKQTMVRKWSERIKLYPEGDWKNFSLETKARIISGETYQIYFRLEGDPEYNNYVVSITDNAIGLGKHIKGNWTNQSSIKDAKFDLNPKDWHTIKIIAKNSNFKIFVDNELKLESEDTQFTKGNIALGTYNSETEFEYITIKPI